MADKKASTTEAKPRKKPVRKAPKLSDYPTRLAWLKAMTEYEEAQAKAETDAKVKRLDKRIASVQSQLEVAQAKLDRLKAERSELTDGPLEVELAEGDEPDQPQG